MQQPLKEKREGLPRRAESRPDTTEGIGVVAPKCGSGGNFYGAVGKGGPEAKRRCLGKEEKTRSEMVPELEGHLKGGGIEKY